MKNDLEDMKSTWQNDQQPQEPLDSKRITAILTTRSKDALSRLQYNLIFEGIVGLIVLACIIRWIIVAPNSSARLAMLQIALLILPCFVFYYYGLKSLKTGVSMNGTLRESLHGAVSFWQRALRIYFWGGVILLPVFIIAVAWYRMNTVGLDHVYILQGSTPVVLLKIAALAAVVSIFIWILVRMSYGNYVDKLKACLTELEENGPAQAKDESRPGATDME